jgi:hypothetical protein
VSILKKFYSTKGKRKVVYYAANKFGEPRIPNSIEAFRGSHILLKFKMLFERFFLFCLF